GDVAKTRYLHKLVKECEKTKLEQGIDPLEHWSIRAKVEILNKNFKQAEQIYLEQGKIEEALNMYEQVQKYEESISLATSKGLPNAQEKKERYIKWLIDTKQEDKA